MPSSLWRASTGAAITAAATIAAAMVRRGSTDYSYFLDDELRLHLRLAVGDRELIYFGPILLELQGRAAAIIARVRAFTGKHGHQLVLTGLEVADAQPLHPALNESRDASRSV